MALEGKVAAGKVASGEVRIQSLWMPLVRRREGTRTVLQVVNEVNFETRNPFRFMSTAVVFYPLLRIGCPTLVSSFFSVRTKSRKRCPENRIGDRAR